MFRQDISATGVARQIRFSMLKALEVLAYIGEINKDFLHLKDKDSRQLSYSAAKVLCNQVLNTTNARNKKILYIMNKSLYNTV